MSGEATVFIVDDDEKVREGLAFLVGSFGYATKVFPSAEEFFNDFDPESHGCLLLDVQMEGWSGLELQQQLAQTKTEIPIIFISGHADVPIASKAFRGGAIDVLLKPVDRDVLRQRIEQALQADASRRQQSGHTEQVRKRLRRLTPRELEVLDLIVDGKSIKQISGHFSISNQTAAKHRSRILDKMGVTNDVELVKLVTSNE